MPSEAPLECASVSERAAAAIRGISRRALDAGAAGYLLKDASSGALANAIRRCRQAGAIDPDLAAQA